MNWFRNAAPYINAHRGRVFVIQFPGEVLETTGFPELVHDIALLDSLGIRLVLVPGIRPQIERRLARDGEALCYVGGLRITTPAALNAVKEATGAAMLDLQALLSMGLPNSPMAGARLRVATGNFVIARPIGIRDGVDFGLTGEVRRIDQAALRAQLDGACVVLVPPLGFSPTGEMFNLSAEEVATSVAIELRAAKLIFLGQSAPIAGADGALLRQLTTTEADALLQSRKTSSADTGAEALPALTQAVRACRRGVQRAHLLGHTEDDALLQELFTRDGAGTMVSAAPFDIIRRARIDDVGGLLELLEPLERQGTLVRRSREKLEMEIERFIVMERDGTIIACAAVYPFGSGEFAEMAGFTVHPEYRNAGRGEQLLEAVQQRTRALGAAHLFVLTTQATHWFQEHGFVPAEISALPGERQATYNYTRRSKVLIKEL